MPHAEIARETLNHDRLQADEGNGVTSQNLETTRGVFVARRCILGAVQKPTPAYTWGSLGSAPFYIRLAFRDLHPR
ncbi:hypothetical protein [Polyangium sp. y55x31]|uniref:hypothetical protein n=1 Tax=Polyangium sp. y55x31 TaxID=3042688 RepID=UPI00248313AA|nr:hypothetical protein [Polyangium sp. y55x31]MDI1479362.1 hypothetical protein [Polyangium sp. y55x31]